MSIISCNNLNVNYDNFIALDNVSFNIQQGDYICIVGENGSGKSTLIKALLGLIPVKKNSISFNGIKQKDIGYLPQQTVVQKDFPASVWEVILSGCLNRLGCRPFYSQKEKDIALSAIEKLNISNIVKKSYRDLSGGQQQRVLLARAICATDKVLLLDEPVTGLDPIVTAEMYSIINQLNKDGVTIIIVSHDMVSSTTYSNKILHLNKQSLFFGDTSDYINSDVYKKISGGGAIA